MDNLLVEPEWAPSVWVRGRPTGYAGGENERTWKAAVAQTLSSVELPASCRVGIESHFRLSPAQVGRNAPDPDNLVKATLDAAATCIGIRQIRGPEQAMTRGSTSSLPPKVPLRSPRPLEHSSPSGRWRVTAGRRGPRADVKPQLRRRARRATGGQQ